MTQASATKQAELEEYLQEIITEGADLDEIAALVDAITSMVAEQNVPVDDFGRPLLPVDQTVTGKRNFFNLRDRAAGDPAKAQDLATWALARYRKAMEQVKATDEAAARQQAMIEAWRQEQTKKAQAEAAFFEGVLDQYREDFAAGEKTVKLPGGALKLTKNRSTISWDEDTAKQWALQQADRVDDYCPRGFSKSAVKADLTKRDDGTYALTDTGEIVEFVKDVEPAVPYSFKVELS